jgi:MSHA pilin protein MshC
MTARGFTLVELITVIVILGILSVFVLPRFLNSDRFEARTVQEQLISAARQAQQLAMDKGTAAAVQLAVDNTNKRIRITYNEGGAQTIDYAVPAGITLVSTAANVSYNGLGDVATAINISILGAGTRNVCIESSGYAHAC